MAYGADQVTHEKLQVIILEHVVSLTHHLIK